MYMAQKTYVSRNIIVFAPAGVSYKFLRGALRFSRNHALRTADSGHF